SPGDPLLDQPRDLRLAHAEDLAEDERRVLAEHGRRAAKPARGRLEPERVALVGRGRSLRVLEPFEEAPAGEHRIGVEVEAALHYAGGNPRRLEARREVAGIVRTGRL